MKRLIENNSSPGQTVYEPFCGSGTTIIAAEMTGRCCHAIELNPLYVDVAIQRWQAFTGECSSGSTLDASDANGELPCAQHLKAHTVRIMGVSGSPRSA